FTHHSCTLYLFTLSLQRSRHHRDLHSFPTRRSSDLSISSNWTSFTEPRIVTVRLVSTATSTVAGKEARSCGKSPWMRSTTAITRSEEHTSELQSPYDLVCRLLLEKKKTTNAY